jgi:hypothetical protein
MWPDDDDARTQAAIEKKIAEVLRYGKFENLGWRGASDAWLERWWPRFEAEIAEGLAKAYRGEKVPVVDAEGMAIATGADIRGATIVPPTRAGWLRFLDLAPRSGESFTTLKEIGLDWWGRRIPQNLLSREKEAADAAEPPAAPAAPAAPTPEVVQAPAAEAPAAEAPAAEAPEAPQAPAIQARPRAGRDAVKALNRRLQLMPQGVRVGSTRYHSPVVMPGDTEIEITFRGDMSDDSAPTMTLIAAPRHGDEIDLRGELRGDDDQFVAQFDWTVMDRRELVMLKETSLARWFNVETTPERKLAPSMRNALAILRAEEDAATEHGEMHPWQGINESTKDALIARGLAIALENTKGGFPHYKTTPAGRALLAEAAPAVAAPLPAPPQRPPSDRAGPFEEARSALKALDLPAKKYAYFLRRAEEAIASGKSYGPTVARARRAAEKLQGAHESAVKPVARKPETRAGTESSIHAAIDRFNAAPQWRIQQLRPRANGSVLVVYPEGQDADAAVAAIDVVHENIDEVRWLADRLTARDQDTILERLEGALWDADDAEDGGPEGESSSPIQALIDLMQRRSSVLGAKPSISQNIERTDGYPQIAEALRDLADPSGISADELQRWLEAEKLMNAGDVVGRSRGAESMSVRELMRELWTAVLDVLPVERIGGKPGDLNVSDAAIFRGNGVPFVLERVREGERMVLRRVRVRLGEEDPETGILGIEDATDRLLPGAAVHQAERGEPFFNELYEKLGSFHDDLVRAPRTLQDVRVLLYWTAAMLGAPLCQGDVKRRATAAFDQAKALHDTARQRLLEGQSVDAVRRLHAAMRRIGAAAADIARSCGEGQIEIGVTPPHLPVRPDDKADVVGGTVEQRP